MPKLENLTKIDGKSGGKNGDDRNGFYRDNQTKKEYFIKFPNDPMELFTELFAGRLLQKFIEEGVIAPEFKASFITADLVETNEGCYGLIQPREQFEEVFKVIGTADKNNADRSVIYEMAYATTCYPKILEGDYGLPRRDSLIQVLFFSLLIGDYSVHSGNVVLLDKGTQLGRIDWGAAFRHFAHEAHSKNNDNILFPYECQGMFNYRGWTKRYFEYYSCIDNVYPDMAARAIQCVLDEKTMAGWIQTILTNLPEDLISTDTRQKLADYMVIPAFANPENVTEVAQIMAATLITRQEKIKSLKVFQASKALSENMFEPTPDWATSSINSLINTWTEQLDSHKQQTHDTPLTIKNYDYNQFGKSIADEAHTWLSMADQYQLWDEQHNYYPTNFAQSIPMHPATALQRKFIMPCGNNQQFEALDAYRLNHPDAFFSLLWQYFEAIETFNFAMPISQTIKINTGSLSRLVSRIQTALENLSQCALLNAQKAQNYNHVVVYDLELSNLSALTGKELLTIVELELYAGYVGKNTAIILTNSELKTRFKLAQSAFYSDPFDDSAKLLNDVEQAYQAYLTSLNIDDDKISYDKLRNVFKALPEQLQTQLNEQYNEKKYAISPAVLALKKKNQELMKENSALEAQKNKEIELKTEVKTNLLYARATVIKQKETIQQWQDQQPLCALIEQLKTMTTAYQSHLQKQTNQTDLLTEKQTACKQLLDVLNKKEALPKTRIDEFRQAIKAQEAVFKAHRDPSWQRFVRDSLRLIALCLSLGTLRSALYSDSKTFFKSSHGDCYVTGVVSQLSSDENSPGNGG